MISAQVVPIPSSFDSEYALPSRDEIARYITPRTKAILYISPENPTGVVYDRQEMDTLRELCERFGLYLISDEVYREFIYDEHVKFTSVLDLPGFEQHAILVDSISKRFSACGARVGSIVTYNRGVMELVDKFAQARLCPPTVGQLAADAAYRMDPSYFTPIRDEYRKRRDTLVTGLRKIPGVSFHVPEGAFYLMARLPVSDAEDFCRFLLADFALEGKTVMLTPGAGSTRHPIAGSTRCALPMCWSRRRSSSPPRSSRKPLPATRRSIPTKPPSPEAETYSAHRAAASPGPTATGVKQGVDGPAGERYPSSGD